MGLREVVLVHIYKFSKKRGFRYGINIKYIARDLGISEGVVRAVVEGLRRDGLVFYVRWMGNVYVLPTKKGRRVVERVIGRV
ncbi:hypothetical protein [Pyrococcus kukulkanii]|uniref:Uncharacterized protein n=1 Tax=Pyrococcus kukulkanii TaxID=1609559 RepID=A0ABV4T5T9_9EURY